jgi:hypothetical protein
MSGAVARILRRHWRTLLFAALGAIGGGLYAQLVGCRTGTCLITSHVWTAALFFGATGAVVGLPGPERERRPARDAGRPSP